MKKDSKEKELLSANKFQDTLTKIGSLQIPSLYREELTSLIENITLGQIDKNVLELLEGLTDTVEMLSSTSETETAKHLQSTFNTLQFFEKTNNWFCLDLLLKECLSLILSTLDKNKPLHMEMIKYYEALHFFHNMSGKNCTKILTELQKAVDLEEKIEETK